MPQEQENIEEKQTDKEEPDYGEVFFKWPIPEFEPKSRTVTWYLAMIVLAGILMSYSIWTQNFLFALIIILITFIVFLKTYSTPRDLMFQITEDGILLGRQFIPYERINSFYFVYKPPVKKLYFDLKSVAPDLSIELNDMNPLVIREVLLEYLDEDLDKETQSFDDQLDTLLKL